MAVNGQGYKIWNLKGYNTSDKSVNNIVDTNVRNWDFNNNGMDASLYGEDYNSIYNTMISGQQLSSNDLSVMDDVMKGAGYSIINPNETRGFWSYADNNNIPLNNFDKNSTKIYAKLGKVDNDNKIAAEGTVIIVDKNGNYSMTQNYQDMNKNLIFGNEQKNQAITENDKTAGTVEERRTVEVPDSVTDISEYTNNVNTNYTIPPTPDSMGTQTDTPEIKTYNDGVTDVNRYINTSNYNNISDIIADSQKRARDEINSGKYNSGMRVSLNISPINRYVATSNITYESYSQRKNYILGDESGLLNRLFGKTNGIIFPYTPQINMNHSVNYEEVEILHSNLKYQYYKNTPPPNIEIQADFTADTPENALYMLGVIWFLRAMTKSDFGKKANRGENNNFAGMPPPTLYLNGYGKMYDNIPVIIKSFNTPMSKDKHYVNVKVNRDSYLIRDMNNWSDIDYYNHLNNLIYDEWLPTEMTISINLEIQPNLKKTKDQFDLNQYKRGILGSVIKDSGNGNIDGNTIYGGSGWTW